MRKDLSFSTIKFAVSTPKVAPKVILPQGVFSDSHLYDFHMASLSRIYIHVPLDLYKQLVA